MPELFPECSIERFLCEYLGFKIKIQTKSNGKADVINRIMKLPSKTVAFGFVDQDPFAIQHPDYVNYQEIDSKFSIKLLRKNDSKHFLVEIENEFEPWIKKINKVAKVNPEKYNVDLQWLHKFNAQEKIPGNYIEFYKEIFKQHPGPINAIKNWIISNIK